MFNGIVEELGEVIAIKGTNHQGLEFTFKVSWKDTLVIGDSVSVNGVCTTVIHLEDNLFRVFTSKQTLAITNLSILKVADKVNLERSLVYGSRISGHIIYGHVDKTLPITSIEKHETSWLFTFAFDPNDSSSVIPKGSIAINGISLTIYKLKKNRLTVMVIPHTFHHTNLSVLKVGDLVNCEFDSLGKFIKQHVEKHLNR